MTANLISKKNFLVILIKTVVIANCLSQSLPLERKADWSTAGVSGTYQNPSIIIDIKSFGGKGDGVTNNDQAFSAAISSLPSSGGVVRFEKGTYLFNRGIVLKSNITIKGSGSSETVLRFGTNSANDHLISAAGTATSIVSNFVSGGIKNSRQITVASTNGLSVGDYVRISLNDASFVTSSWALGSVGQVEKISSIAGNTITISSTLRMDYPLSLSPKITRISPLFNIKVECLKIERTAISSNASVQVSNIYFNKIVNSRITGVESAVSSFAHVQLDESANIEILGSWFHHGLDYGSGGRAYGVLCQSATNLCLIANNVFNHLRHSMILQAGANGNVLAHNFSTDPYQSDSPLSPDFAGDLVIHGNYVFANLMEGNQVSHIFLDDSHGLNGPGNTFLRNRVNGLGISVANANSQNFIGNEVVENKTYSGVAVPNWNFTGTNHFISGNKIRSTNNGNTYYTESTGSVLNDESYIFQSRPAYFQLTNIWPAYGTNGTPALNIEIDAAKRFLLPIRTACADVDDPLPVTLLSFQVFNAGCETKLTWQTADEVNFSHFVIEFSSNGKDFGELAKVQSLGSGGNYDFIDQFANYEIGYYRLKLIDQNGKFSYSRKVFSDPQCDENEISVYPTVTNNMVTISSFHKITRISIYNFSGKLVHQQERKVNENAIDISQFPAGQYLLSVTDGNFIKRTYRVIKVD